MSTTPEDPFQSRPEGEQPMPAAPPYEQPQYAQPPNPQQSPHYAQQPPQYAQQPMQSYPVQQPYGQPVGPRPGTEKNWMGVTALVLGLVGLFTGITAIGGIVFGHLGRAAARRGEADNPGMSLAGLIISYVIVVLGVLVFAGIAILFGLVWNECGGDNPASWCTPDVTATWDTTAL